MCNTPHQNAAQEAEKIKEYAQIVKERDRAVAQVCLWFGFLCVSLCVCVPRAQMHSQKQADATGADRQTDRQIESDTEEYFDLLKVRERHEFCLSLNPPSPLSLSFPLYVHLSIYLSLLKSTHPF